MREKAASHIVVMRWQFKCQVEAVEWINVTYAIRSISIAVSKPSAFQFGKMVIESLESLERHQMLRLTS
jgi:hypothetical protein